MIVTYQGADRRSPHRLPPPFIDQLSLLGFSTCALFFFGQFLLPPISSFSSLSVVVVSYFTTFSLAQLSGLFPFLPLHLLDSPRC